MDTVARLLRESVKAFNARDATHRPPSVRTIEH
jgi:hypothetical protein